MHVHWYPINLVCETCKDPLTVTGIFTSADGEIRFDLICVRCGTSGKATFVTSRLHLQDLMYDMENALEERNKPISKPRPVRPPIIDPSITEKDKSFLHDLGIEGL